MSGLVLSPREEQSLPEGVEVIGSVLTLQGPVELHHAGLYECEASYYSHRASVLLDITVNPHVKQPGRSRALSTYHRFPSQMAPCS